MVTLRVKDRTELPDNAGHRHLPPPLLKEYRLAMRIEMNDSSLIGPNAV